MLTDCTSHQYIHGAATAVCINLPCSFSSDICWCSRQILGGSTILPCASFTGWYKSPVNCIETSKCEHCLTLCLLSSTLVHSGLLFLLLMPMVRVGGVKGGWTGRRAPRGAIGGGLTKIRKGVVRDGRSIRAAAGCGPADARWGPSNVTFGSTGGRSFNKQKKGGYLVCVGYYPGAVCMARSQTGLLPAHFCAD